MAVSQYAYILTNGKVVLEGPAAEIAGKDIRGLYLGLQAG